jgi:hypothetical protein
MNATMKNRFDLLYGDGMSSGADVEGVGVGKGAGDEVSVGEAAEGGGDGKGCCELLEPHARSNIQDKKPLIKSAVAPHPLADISVSFYNT